MIDKLLDVIKSLLLTFFKRVAAEVVQGIITGLVQGLIEALLEALGRRQQPAHT